MSHEHATARTTSHGHEDGGGTDFSGMAELLDLDAEVFHTYVRGATALVRQRAGDGVRRVADLGCGTGAGILALAEHFPDADLFPVDLAEALLDHLMAKARAQGVAGRLRPLIADLDRDWPAELHDLDVIWASASVHHLADPRRGLTTIRSALAPGGWLALVEVDDPVRFLPAFLPGPLEGRGGLEARAAAAVLPELTAELPFLGADWGALLLEAGFAVEADRVFDVVLQPPLPDGAGRLALLHLRRLREHLRQPELEEQVTDDDLAVLDELTDESRDSLPGPDLVPRVRRRLWLARRP